MNARDDKWQFCVHVAANKHRSKPFTGKARIEERKKTSKKKRGNTLKLSEFGILSNAWIRMNDWKLSTWIYSSLFRCAANLRLDFSLMWRRECFTLKSTFEPHWIGLMVDRARSKPKQNKTKQLLHQIFKFKHFEGNSSGECIATQNSQ